MKAFVTILFPTSQDISTKLLLERYNTVGITRLSDSLYIYDRLTSIGKFVVDEERFIDPGSLRYRIFKHSIDIPYVHRFKKNVQLLYIKIVQTIE